MISRSLDLSFEAVRGQTVFDRKRYRWPQSVGRMFPGPHPRSGSVIVQNSGASIHPGDVIEQRVHVGTGAYVQILGQGAMLVTGKPGCAAATESTVLRLRGDGRLIHCPEPRILTRHAHFVQLTDVEIGDGSAVVVDAFVLHPELTANDVGSISSTVRVRCVEGQEPLMVDAQLLDSSLWPRSLRAFGTVYVLGSAATVPALSDVDGVHLAVTELPNGVGHAVRMAAEEGGALRTALERTVRLVR
ncbi:MULTISPECIES: urease accessory protein UreD [unclassified Rhodococcus (in: high G+C Gram-positive bacteria)]|uniref:urease accessory protein UreD n=1 Tax=unclassified Rhodococcus (in: high G+C Gram-positive bacteria) TaxID=192944 RepID=UPI002952FD6E|nr:MULTISPECIES: urease accessory protein UreD [unclassified Rhodococcus (in: high G+C Gram-positive bacteria)]MDV8054288.1 urease accessory protein UreD [Rhodococcus sp. IEGM 1343]MDV8076466.1 urease accessory protein UreD [Rhodococcus sp. IEGM 1370]